MKTAIEIIDETVEYYSHNKRSIDVDAGICFYLSPDGLMCGFSRCCEDPGQAQKMFKDKAVNSGFESQLETDLDIIVPKIEDLLKPEYKGHTMVFWRQIQYLHDTSEYWKDTQLTKDGQRFVDGFKLKYSN